MKKKICLIIGLLSTISYAQINLEWVKSLDVLTNIQSGNTLVDALGNVYSSGYFEGTIDFDPSSAIFNLTSNGNWDVFIQKLDINGNFVWAKSFGGMSYDFARRMTIDNNSNLYITGVFKETVDFDPSSAIFNLTSNNNSDDVFILKLDLNGNFIWAKSFGGPLGDSSVNITTDNSGNIYTTGVFLDNVDFDPSIASFNLTSNGMFDIFIQKLNSDGSFIWAKSIGGTSSEFSTSIITDTNENVYITGYFFETVDFDPNTTTFNLTSNGSSDIFIQKLNPQGDFVWAKSIGGISNDATSSIIIDANNNLYTTGIFFETVDFDPNTDTFNLTSNGNSDIFIQKLNTDGDFIWTKSMGGTSTDYGKAITTDSSEGVYITGFYRGTVDFDPNEPTYNLTSNGFEDIFIQKLDSNGNFAWATSLGGLSNDYGESIVSDNSNSLYVSGFFDDTVDFDPNETSNELTSNSSGDKFYLKISQTTLDIEENNLLKLSIFPNPTIGQVNIQTENYSDISIKVFNVFGQLIYQLKNVYTTNHQFNLNGLAGVYFIEINSNGEKHLSKIIKQ